MDGLGRMQGTFAFAANHAGAVALLTWAAAHGSPQIAGVEGTGSYGYQLTRALQIAGIIVLEVNRPDRANRRRKGKSDPADAEQLPGPSWPARPPRYPRTAKEPSDPCVLTIARNSALKATTTASNQIKAILVSADQELRDAMKVQSLLQLASRASNLAPIDGQHLALVSLGRRWLQLHVEIHDLDTMIRTIVRATAPALLDRPGIGIHTAAQLLITAGGNPERLRNDAAFAARCGVSPVQASSGQTHRHRLSRGGDRAANNALWTIANNRMIHDPRTREFATRRKTIGDRRNDTLRVLKRYIARETFTLIRDALRHEEALRQVA